MMKKIRESAKMKKLFLARESKMRKSFTMIEIVLVLVITGLVGTAGSMAIVQIMQNYALQREYARLEVDSMSAIRQISKYLQDSIWDSIAIQNGNNYYPISTINTTTDGKIENNKELIFIEKNMDIINGKYATINNVSANFPLFSGFVNLANSRGNTITTLSNTDRLKEIGGLKSGNKYLYALHFPYVNLGDSVYQKYYNTDEKQRTSLFAIENIDNDNIMRLVKSPRRIADVAVIANAERTRLLLELDPNAVQDPNKPSVNNLKIIPPLGNLNDAQTIAQKVSQISLWSESASGLIRIRICFVNPTMDFMPEFCKEGIIIQ